MLRLFLLLPRVLVGMRSVRFFATRMQKLPFSPHSKTFPIVSPEAKFAFRNAPSQHWFTTLRYIGLVKVVKSANPPPRIVNLTSLE